MNSALYKGLYMFFAAGAAISFLPTILLAGDMSSILWQLSMGSVLANVGMVIMLTLLEVLYQASSNFAPATLLTFSAPTLGLFAGLMFGDALDEFWPYLLAPGSLLVISFLMAGFRKQPSTH